MIFFFKIGIFVSPNIANILLFNFCEQKFVHNGPITIAIDCNGISLLIFEEKLPNYTSGPKSAPISDSFWLRRLFNVCMRVFCAPNATILLVYITAKIKMSFISKDDFFAKIGIFCKTIAGPLSEASTPEPIELCMASYQGVYAKFVCKSIAGPLPYTQPYSFGERIKLITCQIRQELSVAIHQIRTS